MFLLQSILSACDCVDLHTWAIFSYIQYRLYVLCVFFLVLGIMFPVVIYLIFSPLVEQTDISSLVVKDLHIHTVATHRSPFLVTTQGGWTATTAYCLGLREAEPRALVFLTLIWTNGANKTTMRRQYEGLLGGKQNTLMSLLQCLWIWRKSRIRSSHLPVKGHSVYPRDTGMACPPTLTSCRRLISE